MSLYLPDLQIRKVGDVPGLNTIPAPVVPSRGPSSLGVPSVLSLNSVDDMPGTSTKINSFIARNWKCFSEYELKIYPCRQGDNFYNSGLLIEYSQL